MEAERFVVVRVHGDHDQCSVKTARMQLYGTGHGSYLECSQLFHSDHDLVSGYVDSVGSLRFQCSSVSASRDALLIMTVSRRAFT